LFIGLLASTPVLTRAGLTRCDAVGAGAPPCKINSGLRRKLRLDSRAHFVTMPAMRSGRVAVVWVITSTLITYACAKGGASSGDDTGSVDAPVHAVDARVTTDAPHVDASHLPDAAHPPDAAHLPDAFVPHPDANVVNPPFCSANAECVEPGTCCFVVTCVPGLAIGSACFPS